ncbi:MULTISPECIES: hypothetical protein [unclassified Bradyrhizobium]
MDAANIILRCHISGLPVMDEDDTVSDPDELTLQVGCSASTAANGAEGASAKFRSQLTELAPVV